MKKSVLTFVLFSLFAIPAFAQFTVGANLTIANPQYGFESNSDENIYGVSIDGGYNMYSVMLGGNFSYLYRGGESFKKGLGAIPANVDVDVTNGLVQLHLLARIFLPIKYVQPYAEGLLGGSFFSTTTSVKSPNSTPNNSSGEFVNETSQSDFTYSIGYGAGLMAKVYESEYQSKPFEVWIDFKVRYLKGGEAEYLNSADQIKQDPVTTEYKAYPTKSTTSMNTWHIGVAFKF